MLPQTLVSWNNGWFCFAALAWSAYQAFVGWNYGLYIIDSAATRTTETEEGGVAARKPTKAIRHSVYGAHHAMWYFACSIFGFAALSLFVDTVGLVQVSTITAGGAAVLFAFGAVAVLGVSGALARLLYLGQRLW